MGFANRSARGAMRARSWPIALRALLAAFNAPAFRAPRAG
jgi:hypothetical protein